jgi:hypothetical protein
MGITLLEVFYTPVKTRHINKLKAHGGAFANLPWEEELVQSRP